MTIFRNEVFDNKSGIGIDDDISEHCQWALEHIYKKPYLSGEVRHCHGIQHVSRAAMFGVMWANVRRRYGDREALGLTERELKLIQIALLFHDSARENDNEDLWDNESAINLYKYLTMTLGVSHEEAAKIAEATANKDHDGKNPYQTLVLEDGVIKFTPSDEAGRQKNIFQKIIHDSDCLDILRCEPRFDPRHLDFYKDHCQGEKSPESSMILVEIIAETRALLTWQGDYWKFQDKDKKAHYQTGRVYSRIIEDTKQAEIGVALLRALVSGNGLLDADTLQAMPEFNVPAREKVGDVLSLKNVASLIGRVRQGHPYLLFRGIGAPSAKPKKSTKDETLVELEIRKILRELGNPARSVSLLPSEMYTRAGFLLCLDEESYSDIHSICHSDVGSGFDRKTAEASRSLERERTREQLVELGHNITLEPADDDSQSKEMRDCGVDHNEVQLTIRRHLIKGIAYSRDYSKHSEHVVHTSAIPIHPEVGLLEAYFIQQVYQRQTDIVLPIFEVSHYSNLVREEHVDTEHLMIAWKNVCTAYIAAELKKGHYLEILAMDPETLKIAAIYGCVGNLRAACNQSVDLYYEDDKKDLLNQALVAIRNEEVKKHETSLIQYIGQFDLEKDPAEYLESFCRQSSADLYAHLKSLSEVHIEDEAVSKKRHQLLSEYIQRQLLISESWVNEAFNNISSLLDEICLLSIDNRFIGGCDPAVKKVAIRVTLEKLEVCVRIVFQYFPKVGRRALKKITEQLDKKRQKFLESSSASASEKMKFYELDVLGLIVKHFSYIDEFMPQGEKYIAKLKTEVFDAAYRRTVQEMKECVMLQHVKNVGIIALHGIVTFLLAHAEWLGQDKIALKKDLQSCFITMLSELSKKATSLEHASLFTVSDMGVENWGCLMEVLEIDETNMPEKFLEQQLPREIVEVDDKYKNIFSFISSMPQLVRVLLRGDKSEERFKKLVQWLLCKTSGEDAFEHPMRYIYGDIQALKAAMPNKMFSQEQINFINYHLYLFANKVCYEIWKNGGYARRMFTSLTPLVKLFDVMHSPAVPDVLCRQFFVFTLCYLKLNLWSESNFATKKYIALFERIGVDIKKLKQFIESTLAGLDPVDIKSDAEGILMRNKEFTEHFLLHQGEHDLGVFSEREICNKEMIALFVSHYMILSKEKRKLTLAAVLISSKPLEEGAEATTSDMNVGKFPVETFNNISKIMTIDDEFKRNLAGQYIDEIYKTYKEWIDYNHPMNEMMQGYRWINDITPEIFFFSALCKRLAMDRREADIDRALNLRSISPKVSSLDLLKYLLLALPENMRLRFAHQHADLIEDGYHLANVLEMLPSGQRLMFVKTYLDKIKDPNQSKRVIKTLPAYCRDQFQSDYLTFSADINKLKDNHTKFSMWGNIINKMPEEQFGSPNRMPEVMINR